MAGVEKIEAKEMREAFFFELLQIAIGKRNELTSCLDEEEWALSFDLVKQQQIAGIIYAAIMQLPSEQRPNNKQLLLKWYGLFSKIERRNKEMSLLSEKVICNMRESGFDCMILKGQSLLQYYPDHLCTLRSAGDIDVWVRKAEMKLSADNVVYKYVRSFYPHVKSGYIHIEFPALLNTALEVHIRPCYLANPWYNSRLQQWFEDLDIPRLNRDKKALLAFNKVFLLLHLYKHFIHEGATIRQLMDYYYVLRVGDFAIDEALLKRFGVWQFYLDVLPVLVHVFEGSEIASSRSAWLLHEMMSPLDREGNFWIRKISRAFTLTRYYPNEVLWQPIFSLYSRVFWDRKG